MSIIRFASPRRLAALAVTPLLIAPLAVASPAAAVLGPDSQVFINEIHYDNSGTDASETIEIAGPAGTDLTGWSLVLYNGTGGAPYDTDALLGTVPDTTGNGWGFVTVAYPVNGIQNGAPDGVALVDGSTVVQFLSYEGTFVAAGGPANGLTSSDIGVSEAGSESPGQSLQLRGTGDVSGEFTWAGPAVNTFGAANSGQSFVMAGETEPSVAGTSPANGAAGVPLDADLTITFSEDVAVTPGSITVSCAGTDQPVTVSGGPSSYTVDPTSNLPAAESCSAKVSAAGVTDVDTNDPPDTMTTDYSWSFTTVATCETAPTHAIWEVQGSGAVSPLVGTTVGVTGVVTAVRPGLTGFFLQEEAADSDGVAATSDGVFVRTSSLTGVDAGDVARVTAVVQQFTGSGSAQTQLSPVAGGVLLCGQAAVPDPAALTFPVGDVSEFERYEGMLVALPQSLVISEYFNFDRFNEVVVGLPMPGRDRFDTPTAVVEPGSAATALSSEYAKRRITIDDGRGSQNASPPIFPGTVNTPFSLDNLFRGGDTLTGITGVVEDTFGLYRVHPTADAAYTAVNHRPTSPPSVGGDVKVASFNVLNYFLTLDQIESTTNRTDWICGGLQNLDCRGADAAQPLELGRQRAKIVDAIARLDADVVGLMEMENTPDVEPAADLVDGLNDLLGAGTYDYIDTGVIGTDAIRLGFLYQPASVRPAGDFAVLDSSVDTRFLDDKNRPALAQTFDQVGTGGRFTVAVNHLKSKGSDCNDVGDPDIGDGQGNCNITRTDAAKALADWLANDPTSSGDPDSLIIGDLNSYDHEDPIDALVDAGYTDLVKQFGGEYAYSYVFDGQIGYLDHGLASASLAEQVTGAADWHINADEPDILDYDTSFKGPKEDALYEPNAFRSSDHDPVLVGLDLDPATPEACYTDGSQTVQDFDQGVRLNGTAVPPSMSDESQALGLSDPGDDPYWATLGLGGEIVIEFASPVQDNNLGAADLRVVDAPDGAKGRADRAEVLASFDGLTWHQVGSVAGTGTVDLDPLIAARYIKVVDTTPESGPSSTDGYDLDAIEVLSGCAG